MQVNPKRYIIDKWNGWMSNDEYVWQPGSFLNGEWVDIRSSSKSFSLSRNWWSSQTEVTSLGWYPVAFLWTQISDMIIFLSNGKAIDYFSASALYTPGASYQSCANIITGFDITWVWVCGIIVWSGTTQISRFSYTATPTITVTEGIIASGTLKTSTTYRPLLINNDKLLIGDGAWVSSIDKARVVTNDLQLRTGDEVRNIVRIGDQIVVFAVNGNDWRLYYWDWVSTVPNRVINWYDNAFYNVSNLGNYTYCWGENWIFISDWYGRQFLYKASQNKANVNQYIWPYWEATNAFETLDRVVYIPALSEKPANSSTIGAILSYGEYQPWFPQALVKEFTYWTANTSPQITALNFAPASGTSESVLFYWYKDNSNKYYYGAKSAIWASGFIETNPILWNEASSEKQSKRIRVWYKLPHSSTSIKIYASINDGAYVLIKTITDTTNRRSSFNYDSKWSKIKFKIELLSSNTSYNPSFFDLTFLFNEINDDLG